MGPLHTPAHKVKKEEPDKNCITLPDGSCVGGLMAGLPLCMHDEGYYKKDNDGK